MSKTVFVSGCYDLLHSGHIAFFNQAAQYGDLVVALGSDQTVYDLKGRAPINNEDERLYMVKNVGVVKAAFVSSGSGLLDFEPELRQMQPDMFIVNEDGNTPRKRALCEALGIGYVVLQRTPHSHLPPRSTTDLRQINTLPYRIDLAGGWLDQPFVSEHCPGPVITLSIEPTVNFNERSGMATSTRNVAIDLWGARLPTDDPEKLAWVLFCCDNPPGKQPISGSQDSIGIAMPGLNKAHYAGHYWPQAITRLTDAEALQWVENLLYLVPLDPRAPGYDPLAQTHITPPNAQALADAADALWQAIHDRDAAAFGAAMRQSFAAQVRMFPGMSNDVVQAAIHKYQDDVLGYKLSGAGGGGYLVLVSETPIQPAVRVTARRAWD